MAPLNRLLELLRSARREPIAAHLEQRLDVALAARALARRRHELGREPIRARAREICLQLGRPVPPALEAKP